MRRYRAPLSGPDIFAVRSWAGCITNMFGFELRQAQVKSWGENENSYEPEFWEFQYQLYRYLGRIGEDELIARYDDIVRNLRAIVSDDRHVIPVISFLSSWYWYRKEHQTRYEFALRKNPLARTLPVLGNKDLSAAPTRPRSPNAADVLFRYGSKKRLQELVEFGKMRISAAREYSGRSEGRRRSSMSACNGCDTARPRSVLSASAPRRWPARRA
jgi:hypothetical protein